MHAYWGKACDHQYLQCSHNNSVSMLLHKTFDKRPLQLKGNGLLYRNLWLAPCFRPAMYRLYAVLCKNLMQD